MKRQWKGSEKGSGKAVERQRKAVHLGQLAAPLAERRRVRTILPEDDLP